MNGILIEKARIADAEAMLQCVRRAYRHYIDRIGKEPGPMLDDYRARAQQDETYVIRHDSRVTGVLVMVPGDSGILLDNVAVDPDWSGKGLGRELVSFAENRARELGYDEIELYTHERMTENIEMYLKWGYREVRRVREKGYDRVYMAKALAEPDA